MGAYASEHQSARLDIMAAGAAVTFVRTRPGTYDPLTDSQGPPAHSQVSGFAIKVQGERGFAGGEVVQVGDLTLLFAPDAYGAMPEPGDATIWAGETYMVASVDPVAPDGVPIIGKVVCNR